MAVAKIPEIESRSI